MKEPDQLQCNIIEKIQLQINEIVQQNCLSGDITPFQTTQLEEYTEKLAVVIAQVVRQNQ